MNNRLALQVICVAMTAACTFDPSGVRAGNAFDANAPLDASGADASGIDAGSPDAMLADAMLPDAMPPDAMLADAMPLPSCTTNPDYVTDPVSGRAYHLMGGFSDRRNWNNASALCTGEEAYLAVIDSQEENDYVRGLQNGNSLWIGLHDMNVEDSFEWVNGAALVFTNWNGGEPNDSFGEDCGEMTSGGGWNDLDCGDVLRFVCECDPAYIP